MSQQYMGFDDNYDLKIKQSESENAPYYSASANVAGQKLSPHISFTLPSPKQRLALAIVSIVVWAITFFLAMLFINMIPLYISVPSTIPGGIPAVINNPNLYIIYIIIGSGLLVFSAIIVSINVIFNRK